MDYTLNIPQCVIESSGEIQVPAMRRIAIERRKDADPVGCRIPTDPRLLHYRGPVGGLRRIAFLGYSLMEALEDQWPQFHDSVVNGRVLRTRGTTIYVTGRTKGGGETITATWNYGEHANVAMGRLNRLRRLIADLPDEVAYRLLSTDWTPDLPPPQALLSDCIEFGEDDPDTSLFGCGGAAHVSFAVGVKSTAVVADHRLHDPPHWMALVRSFNRHLDEAIGRWELRHDKAA